MRARAVAVAAWVVAGGALLIESAGGASPRYDGPRVMGCLLCGVGIALAAIDPRVRSVSRGRDLLLAIAIACGAVLGAQRLGRVDVAQALAGVPLALAIWGALAVPSPAARRQVAVGGAAMVALVMRGSSWIAWLSARDDAAAIAWHDVEVRLVRLAALGVAALVVGTTAWRARGVGRSTWCAAAALLAAAAAHEVAAFAVADHLFHDPAVLDVRWIEHAALAADATALAAAAIAGAALVRALIPALGARGRRARAELASVAAPLLLAVLTSSPAASPHVQPIAHEDPGGWVDLPAAPRGALGVGARRRAWVIDRDGSVVDVPGLSTSDPDIELVVDRETPISLLTHALAPHGARRYWLRAVAPSSAGLGILASARARFPAVDARARSHVRLELEVRDSGEARSPVARRGPCEAVWPLGPGCGGWPGPLQIGAETRGTVGELVARGEPQILLWAPAAVATQPMRVRKLVTVHRGEPGVPIGAIALVAAIGGLTVFAVGWRRWRHALRGRALAPLSRGDARVPITPAFVAPSACDRALVEGGAEAYRVPVPRRVGRTASSARALLLGVTRDLGRALLAMPLAVIVAAVHACLALAR